MTVSDETKEKESSNKEEEFVPKSAYQEVTQDMHKYKKEFKTLQAQLSKLQTEREEEQRQRDEDQAKWKDLYEREKAKSETSTKALSEKEKRLTDMIKLNAVRSQIGEVVKDDFFKFVPLEKISLDETGLPDSTSVKEVAEWFKQEYPMVLKKSSNGALPATSAGRVSAPQPKPLSQMNKNEILGQLRGALAKENK